MLRPSYQPAGTPNFTGNFREVHNFLSWCFVRQWLGALAAAAVSSTVPGCWESPEKYLRIHTGYEWRKHDLVCILRKSIFVVRPKRQAVLVICFKATAVLLQPDHATWKAEDDHQCHCCLWKPSPSPQPTLGSAGVADVDYTERQGVIHEGTSSFSQTERQHRRRPRLRTFHNRATPCHQYSLPSVDWCGETAFACWMSQRLAEPPDEIPFFARCREALRTARQWFRRVFVQR